MRGVWFLLPLLGPVRISTVLGAILLFGVVAYVRRDLFLALVTTAAWASTFEIICNLVGVVSSHWPLDTWAWTTAALAGWVLLSWRLGARPDWRIVGFFALIMAAWVALGFHSNVPDDHMFSLRDEVLNEIAKSSLGLAYLVGAVRQRSNLTGHSTRQAIPDETHRARPPLG